MTVGADAVTGERRGGTLDRFRSVAVLDPSALERQALVRDFNRHGCDCLAAAELRALQRAERGWPPSLIVAELRFDDGEVFEQLLASAPKSTGGAPVIILTDSGSIASAVRAIRMGALDYLTKPATAAQLFWSARFPGSHPGDDAQPRRLTLERAKWEIIHRAVEDAGTISGAARILGLEPRSLRRMLKKYPPDQASPSELQPPRTHGYRPG